MTATINRAQPSAEATSASLAGAAEDLRMTKGSTNAVAASLVGLFLLLSIAGCGRPSYPPIFSVDRLSYWWEGKDLIVNLTFTNRANFSAYPPWLYVYLGELKDKRHEQDSDYVWEGRFLLSFDPSMEWPWQTRWYEPDLYKARFGGLAPSDFGPVPKISTGFGFSPEIVFRPPHEFHNLEGFYEIHLEVLADYPAQYDTIQGSTQYYTGCFNHDTPEFYGVNPANGSTCFYWDCSGVLTEGEYGIYVHNGKPKESYLPKCDATNATGPYV